VTAEARLFSTAAARALEADLEHCRWLTRRSRSSFYYAFYLLERDRRDALCAVYAFCRAADDIADVADAVTHAERLSAWRDELDRVFRGVPRHPIGRALAWAADSFALERQPFDDLIDGVTQDLSVVRYRTAAELERYCYQVASTVGLICIRIFGVRGRVADRYATDLGIAFQLTNILRDIAEDARRGRIYLPLEDLDLVGCSEETVLARRPTPELARLIALECARAEWLYARAAAAIPASVAAHAALAPAEAMHRIYRALLERVRAAGVGVLSVRPRVAAAERAWLAASAWVSASVTR
jgi:phytoene synthase